MGSEMCIRDRIYFAPKDNVVRREVEKQGCFDDPGEFCAHDTAMTSVLAKPIWSSYVLSPAAMFNPNVMANPEKGGWTNPLDHAWWIPIAKQRAVSISLAENPHH